MTTANTILRYLLSGQATADALSGSLNLSAQTVSAITAYLLAGGEIETHKIGGVLPIFRLTAKARQQLTAPTP